MKKGLLLAFVMSYFLTEAQVHTKSSRLVSSTDAISIAYGLVHNLSTGATTTSNENGDFHIHGVATDSIIVSSLGYQTTVVQLGNLKSQLMLIPSTSYLDNVTVEISKVETPGAEQLDKLTLKLQPVNNAQDLLVTMNGVFIAQHAGGGKAEQIFLRGFDNDHGTDFAVYIDDVPVNLSSHAHGQGYADMHFIIPETIDDADYFKGPHEMKNGDFAVSGAARYKTTNGLTKSMVKTEIGLYGYKRGLVAINLTPNNHLFSGKRYEKAYIALEGTLNDGFFESPQHFKKFSALAKYNTELTKNTSLTWSTFYFTSDWDASGQIPLRAVEDSSIDWFGAIDDTEGGNTSRLITSLKFSSFLPNNTEIKNHLYYSHNAYQLYSNFTFFMNDSFNGDMINQEESRNTLGYSFEYEKEHLYWDLNLKSTLSAGVRSDFVHSSLESVVEREFLDVVNNDVISQSNYWVYFKENWKPNDKWLVELGSRYDLFHFNVEDQIGVNTSGKRTASRFSPKLSAYFNPNTDWQLFMKTGQGFHSNYSHSAVEESSIHPLAKAKALDIGVQFKIRKKLISNLTLWVIQSDAEYVFVADAGEFENNGTSLRRGIDFSAKYNPISTLWINYNGNLSSGVLLDNPEGERAIPAAPRFTSTASVTYKHPLGIEVYFGAKYMARRPLVEDESVFADDYLIFDQSITYTYKRFQIGLSTQNLLNDRWMEAVFYDASQLQTEDSPVDDYHFTPGTPRFIKGQISYSF